MGYVEEAFHFGLVVGSKAELAEVDRSAILDLPAKCSMASMRVR